MDSVDDRRVIRAVNNGKDVVQQLNATDSQGESNG